MLTTEYLFDRFGLPPQQAAAIEVPGVTRDVLGAVYRELGFTVGAEIGVESGRYAKTMLEAHPTLHLHCVDAWQAYPGYREHVTQAKVDGLLADAQTRLAGYHVSYHRMFSVEAAAGFPDRSLDFVYIDANHDLLHVTQDLVAWTPKVRSGGLIAGHDYCKRKQSGYQVHVVEAVHAFTQAYHILPWFILGAKAIVDGVPRDRPRSYLWVQP